MAEKRRFRGRRTVIRAPIYRATDSDCWDTNTDFGADGDGVKRSSPVEDKPSAPLFQEECFPKKRLFQSMQQKKGNDTSFEELLCEHLFDCPICMDLRIESTAAHCGHKFCRTCLDEWTVLKPICPVCGDEIKEQDKIRLYEDDHFIEEHLLNFSKHSMMRWQKAKTLRAERRPKPPSKWNVFGRTRKSLDSWILLYRCKGMNAIARKSASFALQTLLAPWKVMQQVGRIFPRSTFVMGLLIGVLVATVIHNIDAVTNFVQYLYLAIKQYDGKLPDSIRFGEGKVVMDNEEIDPLFSMVKPRLNEQESTGSLVREESTSASDFDNVFSYIGRWLD